MNKNNRGESTLEAFAFLIVILTAFGCGILAGWAIGVKGTQTEAVKRGHAEWVVSTEGSITFAWKGEKELEKAK